MRYRIRHFMAIGALLTLTALTCGPTPIVQNLIQRVEALEAETALIGELTTSLEAGLGALAARVDVIEQVLFSEPVETVLLDDDFEDGIDPAWVQVYGTTQTIVPTSGCDQAYWSGYSNCGSLGLHFDELERYDYELPVPAAGSFSLYFHDDPADTNAAAWVGVLAPGGQERLGVATSLCPDTYYISLNAGYHRCTIIPRRLGWHRLEFVRTGLTTRGYFDHILVFETNHGNRPVIERVTVIQEFPYSLLDGFAIDDVRFVATE
jgi:hypothetical protein